MAFFTPQTGLLVLQSFDEKKSASKLKQNTSTCLLDTSSSQTVNAELSNSHGLVAEAGLPHSGGCH
jgi:hypothetical protein